MCCPGCGHVLSVHKSGGCYGENLACACPLDREEALAALQQPGAIAELLLLTRSKPTPPNRPMRSSVRHSGFAPDLSKDRG